MALRRGQLDQLFMEADLPHLRKVPLVQTRKLFIDFETFCKLDLKKVGLDRYARHPSCEVLMCSWGLDGEEVELWDKTNQPDMPTQLREMLEDPDIEIHAFNAQFERVIMMHVLGITPKITRWRCTMALAYMHSFTGSLEMVGHQVGIAEDKQKLTEGKRLIRMFTQPQKVTKNQPLSRFDDLSHPIEWERFKEYCRMDNIAEQAIDEKLDKPQFPIPDREWQFYALDQIINDRGLPIDRTFCENALAMANRRKAILMARMNALTGLANSNSGTQFLPWLHARGYPFEDLQKPTVIKVLARDKLKRKDNDLAKNRAVDAMLVKRYHQWQADLGFADGDEDEQAAITNEYLKQAKKDGRITTKCRRALVLRQKAARTSTSKYAALLNRMHDDDHIRYVFQFCGASRTGRFAGRGFQPQNLTTIRDIEDVKVLEILIECVRNGDDEYLALLRKEPLDALAGLVRSAVRAPEGKVMNVCDLASIESVVIGWVTKCERLLNVFRNGKDAYKDFATELYQVAYEAVTKLMRKMSKPATLGAGYRLGGGARIKGKKTGLWGYAENMGVEMTKEESHKNVATFRRVYKEIPQCWYDLEAAIIATIKEHRPTTAARCKFLYRKPYLVCQLPSGRCIYYHKPRVEKKPFTFVDKDTGEDVTVIKDAISYMGKQQNGSAWIRVYSHGGKFIENIVQAIARDILRECMIRLHNAGFYLFLHVHDEAVSLEDVEDKEHTYEKMREIMIQSIKWAKGMPLGAAGFRGFFYRKD